MVTRFAATREELEQMTEQAVDEAPARKERVKEQILYDKYVLPGQAGIGGFLTDIPGALGFENFTTGPGIISALDRNKQGDILGSKEGLEEFVSYDPVHDTYFDQLRGEYKTSEGKLVGVDTELRDYIRENVGRKSGHYSRGQLAMLATDVAGAPAFAKMLITQTPRLLNFVGKTVPQYLLEQYPKTMATAIGTAIAGSSTAAEANTKIKKIASGVAKTTGKAKYSASTITKGEKIIKKMKLKDILAKLDANFNPSSKYTKMHETKKKVAAYKFNNPNATTDEISKKFGISHGTAGNYIDEAGLASPTTGITKQTLDEIELIRKKFYEYKKANKNVAPSMTQLSDYMGLTSSGKVSKISRIKDNVKKNHGYDPFEGLNFKLGTATKEGTYTVQLSLGMKNFQTIKWR